MSNLTDLLPAGAGGKQVDFVASGTIGNGVTVALKSDGTVEAVSGVTAGAGTPVVFEAASTRYTSATFDSNLNKVVVAYQDVSNSSYGTAIVGTVSGTSISFGTPVVFESAESNWCSVVFDTNSNKVVIAYNDNASFPVGTAIVGTVSGTAISFGSAKVFDANDCYQFSSVFDSSANKVVIAYNTGYNRGRAVVGTVSGTSISFGSTTIYNSARTENIAATFDSSNNKVVIAYRDNFSSSEAVVGTVSGTSISFGTPVVIGSIDTIWASTFDSNAGKVVLAFYDPLNSYYGSAIVGTVSGTSISFGTPVVFNSEGTFRYSTTFNSSANKVVISYRGGSSTNGSIISGAVSGTSIAFGTSVVFETGSVDSLSSTYDSTNDKVVTTYEDLGNSDYGTASVFQSASSNNTSFIGISDAAISDTASGSVTIKGGISANVTGLTPNSTYYVQSDGSLSTTASDVLAGKALSSTSINLDYTT